GPLHCMATCIVRPFTFKFFRVGLSMQLVPLKARAVPTPSQLKELLLQLSGVRLPLVENKYGIGTSALALFGSNGSSRRCPASGVKRSSSLLMLRSENDPSGHEASRRAWRANQ